jgi:gas vesicle protein
MTNFIRMEPLPKAPFSIFATDSESKVISDKLVNDLQTLTWESLVVKNYCIAVNQQASIKIASLPKLPLIQKTSRSNADLWLNKHAISINDVYNEASYFTDSYDATYDTLTDLAKDLSGTGNKELFTTTLQELQTTVNKVKNKIEALNRNLQEFRPRLETDVRNFSELIADAKKLAAADRFKVTSLSDELEDLKKEIKNLNSKIAATATMGTLTWLGAIGILVGVLTFEVTGGLSFALVGTSLGLVAGGGASFGLLGEYNRQLKEKKARYSNKTLELQKVQEEIAAATAIEKQYTPLVESGGNAIKVVQTLLEGWQEIFSNFNRFIEEVIQAKNADADKIRKHLDVTKDSVNKIKEVIGKHKDAGVIRTYSDGEAAITLAPGHMALNRSNTLVLPTRLHMAYVKRMYARLPI